MASFLKLVKALPNLPKNVKLKAETAAFERAMTDIPNSITPGKQLAPAFVMLDPFGVKGVPMALIQRILKNGHAKLCISFMYESIDRFKSTPEFDPILTTLYGSEEWKKRGLVRRDELLDLLDGHPALADDGSKKKRFFAWPVSSHTGQLKAPVFVPMEREGIIEVDSSTRKRS